MKYEILAINQLTLIFLVFISLSVNGQTSGLKGTIRPQLYVSDLPVGMYSCNVGLNYGILNCLTAGLYAGSAAYRNPEPDLVDRNDVMFGTTIRGHLTELTAKKEFPVLELFITGKFGLWSSEVFSNPVRSGRSFDYGLYAGVAFYPVKNIGLLGEVGYGNNSIAKLGVILRFQL